jgi:hypothetical protein
VTLLVHLFYKNISHCFFLVQRLAHSFINTIFRVYKPLDATGPHCWMYTIFLFNMVTRMWCKIYVVLIYDVLR